MSDKCPKCSGSLIITPAGNAVCEKCSYKRVATEKEIPQKASNALNSRIKEANPEFYRKNQCPKCLEFNKFWERKVDDMRKCPACDELFSEEEYELIYEGEYSAQAKEKLQQAKEKLQRLEVAERKRKEERQRLEVAERKRKEDRQRLEEEKRNRETCKASTKELSAHSKSGGDYIGLESSLRTQSENLFSRTAAKPVHEWQQEEADLIRLLLDYPKRKECLSLAEDSNEETKLILTELKKLNALMEALVQGQGKQIGMSKDNQNAAKIGIAAHLLTGGTAGAVARGIEDVFDSDEE